MAKAYLYNQGGTLSAFRSTLACFISNLSNWVTCMVYLSFKIHTNSSQFETDYLSWRNQFQNVTIFVLYLKWHFSFRFTLRCIFGILTYQSVSTLLHAGNSITHGALGLNALNHPWQFQLSYAFPLLHTVHRVLPKLFHGHL